MDMFNPISIDGRHVKVRSLRTANWEQLSESLLYEDSWYGRMWNITTPEDIKKMYERLIAAMDAKMENPIVFWDIEQQRILGITNFMNIEPQNRLTEIGGTWIGKKWQKTFTNTETKYLLLKYCFEQLNLVRVEFRIDCENTQSIKAIERIGAKFEGVIRNRRIIPSGQSRDRCFYSVVDRDWHGVKIHLEKLLAQYEHPYSESLSKTIELRKAGQFDEAFAKVRELIALYPSDPILHYHAAWICDAGRTETEAAQFYENSIELGLNGPDKRDALLGLGSTYRSLGQFQKSKDIFVLGIKEFPDYRPYKVFLALSEYNLKNPSESMRLLLGELIDTTGSNEIKNYERALRFYSDKLDDSWK